MAIARGHFFVVQELLKQEQVVIHLMFMPYDLYRCFQLSIASCSLQILRLLTSVFADQISDEHILGKASKKSFFEISEFDLSQEGLRKH